jgi:hypothetical protein
MSMDLSATEFFAEHDVLSPENVKRIIRELPHVCEGRVQVSEELLGVFQRAQPNFKVLNSVGNTYISSRHSFYRDHVSNFKALILERSRI